MYAKCMTNSGLLLCCSTAALASPYLWCGVVWRCVMWCWRGVGATVLVLLLMLVALVVNGRVGGGGAAAMAAAVVAAVIFSAVRAVGAV